jgi:hypothetical protein
MSGTASNPWVLDDSDPEEAPRPSNGPNDIAISGATRSTIVLPLHGDSRPGPTYFNTAPQKSLRNGTPHRSSASKMMPSNPPPPGASHGFTTINDSGPKIKISPESSDKVLDVTLQTDFRAPAKHVEKSGSSENNEEDADEEMDRTRNFQLSTGTPSMRSSRGRASPQKSSERSLGSESPLVRRLKEQKARLNTTSSSSASNVSPRDDMLRRGLSNESEQGQNVTVARIEQSLQDLEQMTEDDHAVTVRWLLHDAKKAAKNTDSAFVDKVSPFDSMKPIHLSAGGTVPDGSATVKLESHVWLKNPIIYAFANEHRSTKRAKRAKSDLSSLQKS